MHNVIEVILKIKVFKQTKLDFTFLTLFMTLTYHFIDECNIKLQKLTIIK